MSSDILRRLPLYSLLAGILVAAVLLTSAVTGFRLPGVGLGALAMLPLAAAIVDAVRLKRGSVAGGAGQGPQDDLATSESDLSEWLEEKADALNAREKELNAQALALQQWMQFPDAIDFTAEEIREHAPRDENRASPFDDPMARHDRELFALIESKTRQLFDDIKQDAYRVDDGEQRVFDNQKIRQDLVALVSDVAAIYRPGETSPFLQTNVEAISRAIGRGSLRLLVAIESLPGGLASYDFQSIYTIVIRAVKAFGIYKSAKPYLDIASGVLFAGRIVSTTNPLTLAAWWAAGRATTYGASKLGTHLIDQQAVGLVRQLVEIVAIEVASVYSPMVRYRDVHWIYGVELVNLASELAISDSARVEAMKQIASLNLLDEYGRVSLMRHVAGGTTANPTNYRPAESLSPADRTVIAQRLEAFLLAHVLKDRSNPTSKSAIEDWQQKTSDRLEIRFRQDHENISEESQTTQACWSIVAFCVEHLGDEPDEAIGRLSKTKTWQRADKDLQRQLEKDILADPQFLYHPPSLDPESDHCEQFLDDLVELAGSGRKPSPPTPIGWNALPASFDLPMWSGEQAIGVTAYYLRADVEDCIKKYHRADVKRLFGRKNSTEVTRSVARVLDLLARRSADEEPIRALYNADAVTSNSDSDSDGDVHLTLVGSRVICFRCDSKATGDPLAVTILDAGDRSEIQVEKISGYIRSDCKVSFPSGTKVTLPGSTLAGYESFFGELLERVGN